METAIDLSRHPCFNLGAKGSHGRVHLPVAPKCNLGCNYCNRKYDCVNESRPGVTSALLAPHQALAYLERVAATEPRISVAGVAGPGDPMANPEATLTTLRLIRAHFPRMLVCLSTNGLAMPAHLDEVAELATHVTITINAVDPAIGQKIYAWARDGKVIQRGRAAAELLWERQRESLIGLKRHGVTVKVNTIVIPGLNQEHVGEVARVAAGLGADLHNLMPIRRVAGTPLGEGPEPAPALMARLRGLAGEHLPQMTHCTRCRADAVGLLGADRSGEMAGCLAACAALPAPVADSARRPHVAVATREGLLVNLHLGQAPGLQIWTARGDGFALVEERPAPEPGCGPERWRKLAEALGDCRAVLASAMGEAPRQALAAAGIQAVEMEGFIEPGLRAVYGGGDLAAFGRRRGGGCCRGGLSDGPGCG
ncbi:MAG: radical SAM protein [Thermodesulfobacteriota bacterium]